MSTEQGDTGQGEQTEEPPSAETDHAKIADSRPEPRNDYGMVYADINVFGPETVIYATAAAIYGKAFLETLGQRTGEGVASLPKRLGDVVRRRHAGKGKHAEYLIGVDEATAILIITEGLPDEARLAVLDLDVTAEEIRGKYLRWDSAAEAWRPYPFEG